MNSIDLEFRRAIPEDVEQAIPLIYSAGPAEFDYCLAVRGLRSLDYLRVAFVARKNLLGCEKYTVVVTEDRVVGIGTFYNGEKLGRMMVHGILPTIRFYGLRSSIEVLRRSRHLDKLMPPPDKDTEYFNHLGVAEDMRGRGIGTALIERQVEIARQKNRRICALDVAVTNPRAQRLYERLGFEVVRETKWHRRALAEEVSDMRRMELVL